MKKMIVLALAVAGAGCAIEGEPAVETTRTMQKVVDETVEGGVRLEIFAGPDGAMLATQSGPIGTPPVQIPKDAHDPVALYRHMTRGRPVPEALLAAQRQALAERARAGASAEAKLAPPLSPAVPAGGQAQPFIVETESNWSGHCDSGWFARNWCTSRITPGDDGVDDVHPITATCLYNKHSVIYESRHQGEAWGAVCASVGQLTFRVSDNGQVSDFTVDQGSWRTAVTFEFVQRRIRFEMVDRPDDSAGHFAADVIAP